jgi:NAD-dependent deacetylase
MARFEHRLPRVWVLTQNVDGLHAAAGSRNVIAIHGDIHDLLCTACDWQSTVPDYSGLEALTRGEAPRCPRCGAVMRPRVVLFEESLPISAMATLREQMLAGFDVVVSVGTSSLFPYITEPVLLCRRAGALTVEINPGQTSISGLVDVKLPLRAAEALQRIAELAEPLLENRSDLPSA